MTDVNRAMLEAVFDEIGDLRDDVVFIGGAIAGLLITSSGGDPIRETDDVDCIIELGSSVLSYRQIEMRLQALVRMGARFDDGGGRSYLPVQKRDADP